MAILFALNCFAQSIPVEEKSNYDNTVNVELIVKEKLIYKFDTAIDQIYGLENKNCKILEKEIICDIVWIKRVWYDEVEIPMIWFYNKTINKICVDSDYKMRKSVEYNSYARDQLPKNCFYNLYEIKIIREKFPIIQIILYLVLIALTFGLLFYYSKNAKS